MSQQEFQLQTSDQDQDKGDDSFFINLERKELSDTLSGKESPAVALSSSSSNEEGPDNKSSNYFTHLDTTIENLQKRTQQVIDKINENRKKDHALMNSFRENLLMKVSNLAEKLEERVFPVYDHHNKLIQDKLQDLSEIMERIKQIETELRQVCHTVEKLYKDLCSQSEL